MAGQRDHSIEMRDLAANTARTGGLNCGKVDMTLKCRRVRFWHKADIARVWRDVRFRGQSGHQPEAHLCSRMTQSEHGGVS